jgi:hypothetical protein
VFLIRRNEKYYGQANYPDVIILHIVYIYQNITLYPISMYNFVSIKNKKYIKKEVSKE